MDKVNEILILPMDPTQWPDKIKEQRYSPWFVRVWRWLCLLNPWSALSRKHLCLEWDFIHLQEDLRMYRGSLRIAELDREAIGLVALKAVEVVNSAAMNQPPDFEGLRASMRHYRKYQDTLMDEMSRAFCLAEEEN